MRIQSYGNIAYVLDESGLPELLNDYPVENYQYVFLGNGSNILLTKELYDDYIFVSLQLMNSLEIINDEIRADAGCSLSALSWFALSKAVKGYSFMEDIPGSVGGAVVMNAGTYDDYIGNLVSRVRFFDLKRRCFETVECTPSMFGKRRFDLTDTNRIFTTVWMKCDYAVEEEWYPNELNCLLETKRKRYLKQPRKFPNAGSVFVRPQPIDGKQFYVWQLLNECGLRGYSVGDAAVSSQHPGFIVNLGDGKPKDFLDLIAECKNRVKEKYGVTLELEWKTI